jgi:TRAP-type C4-dicarboxylate transport system substrate-binding protein
MKRLIPALLLASALAAPARAQEVKIKLGTVAPAGSTWHELLKEMGEKWKEASGGTVQLKVYAGGVLGSEGDMVRKLNIGQIHAAAMTTVGLREISADPQAEDTPGLIDSYEEYEYVHERMREELERGIEAKGYVVLNWGEAGFVNVFSTDKHTTPKEFGDSKVKVFTWSGDPASERAWKEAGFNPVVLSGTDLVPSLQTGMINVISQPPLYVYAANLFDKTKYMLDLHWGLLTGATIVKKDQWEKIPAELREKLLHISREYGKKVVADVRQANDDALKKMTDKGLQVVEPADRAAWDAAYAKAQAVVRGDNDHPGVVPMATFDKVKALRDEYRREHEKK